MRKRRRGSASGLTIMPDIPAFVSPIDGKVVSGRAALREHNKRHNVTNVADFKETWAKAEREREKFYKGDGYDSQRRKERLKESIERLQSRPRRK